jgi:hypothetical protein
VRFAASGSSVTVIGGPIGAPYAIGVFHVELVRGGHMLRVERQHRPERGTPAE